MSRCTSPAACATSSASHTLNGDAHRLARRQHTGLIQHLQQRRASDQLHHDERPRAVHTGVEYRHRPRITEHRRVPRLPLKPGQETRIGSALRAEHLGRNLTAQNLIAARHTVAMPPTPITSASAYRPPSTRAPVIAIAAHHLTTAVPPGPTDRDVAPAAAAGTTSGPDITTRRYRP